MGKLGVSVTIPGPAVGTLKALNILSVEPTVTKLPACSSATAPGVPAKLPMSTSMDDRA